MYACVCVCIYVYFFINLFTTCSITLIVILHASFFFYNSVVAITFIHLCVTIQFITCQSLLSS